MERLRNGSVPVTSFGPDQEPQTIPTTSTTSANAATTLVTAATAIGT